MDEIEVEFIDENLKPTLSSLAQQEQQFLTTELQHSLNARLNDIEALKLKFINSDLSAKDKLDALLAFKATQLIPSMKRSLGLDYDTEQLRGSFDTLQVLSSIEQSIMNIIKFEESEVINFTNPKITSSYKMLFETIIEVLQTEIKEQVLINNIIEKVAVRCVSLETEFNKIFRNVSNKFAEFVENPLTEAFRNKDKDPVIIKQRLSLDITRAYNTLDKDTILEIVNNTLNQARE